MVGTLTATISYYAFSHTYYVALLMSLGMRSYHAIVLQIDQVLFENFNDSSSTIVCADHVFD